MNNRDTCIFYRSIYEAVKLLPEAEQAGAYRLIFDYSLDFVKPELDTLTPSQKMVWLLVEPVLTKGNTNYINGSKPKQKRNESETEANVKRNGSEQQAYKDKDKDKDKDKEKDKDLDKDSVNGSPQAAQNKKKSFKNWNADDLLTDMKQYADQFNKEMLNAFYHYWTEPRPSGKPRLTAEDSWDTLKRLKRWQSNNTPKPQKTFTRASLGETYK